MAKKQTSNIFEFKKFDTLPDNVATERSDWFKELPKSHPMKNPENHQELIRHLQARLTFGNNVRNASRGRMEYIDRDFAGYIRHEEADRKRERENQRGIHMRPTPVNIPLIWQKLDDLVTFLADVFAPDTELYQSLANPQRLEGAEQLTRVMNNDAKRKAYYTQIGLFAFAAFKYNLTAAYINFVQDRGTKLVDGDAGLKTEENAVIWEGNEFKAVDMYNFIWDASVRPEELPEKGEFAAIVDVMTKYRVYEERNCGRMHNVDDYLQREGHKSSMGQFKWYRPSPIIRVDIGSYFNNDVDGQNLGQPFDWLTFLQDNNTEVSVGSYERVRMYVRLEGKRFGLTEKDGRQIWLITIINNEFIAFTEEQTNHHSMLPFVMAVPNDDGFSYVQNSIGENYRHGQRHASFLFNVNTVGLRKSLHGITIYDKTKVDLSEVKDDVAARIPMNQSAQGVPIDQIVQRIDPQTNDYNTMEQIFQTMDLMENTMPTDSLKQVAGIDRAVEMQVAATIQSADRRMYKMARVINSQAMRPARRMMILNLLQFRPSSETIAPDGSIETVNLQKYKAYQLENYIGEGLKSLEAMVARIEVRNIINSLLQAPQVAGQIDMVELINFLFRLYGYELNLNRFRLSPQQQQLQTDLQQPTADTDEGETAAISNLMAAGGPVV